MKYLSLVILFLILSDAVFAQKDSVAFTPRWKKGDILKYQVSKTRSDYSNTRLVSTESSSYVVTIIVGNMRNGLYDFEWKYENNMLSGKPLPAVYKPVIDKYKYLTVKYQTNSQGVFQRITNLAEQTAMVNEINKIMAEAEVKNHPGIPLAVIEKAKERKSPEVVEGLLSKEIKLVHWAMSRKLPVADTVRYKTEMPDFFTKEPAKASGKIFIDSVNINIYIKNTVTAEDEESKKMLSVMLSTMLPPLQGSSDMEKEARSRQISAIAAGMRFALKEENSFIYGYSGWPVKIVSSTKATITSRGVDEKEEITEISRVR